MEPKYKEYKVQFRVVAIVGIKIKATDMEDALEASKGYGLSNFLQPKLEVHDGGVKVVGVDDDWGDTTP